MKLIFGLVALGFLIYLLLPSPDFPAPPPDSLQSKEMGDTENPLRRAYFTNYTREEVISWYRRQFTWGIRLNYPPEESRVLIRDQTKSTFLEEIVQPFRESVYINGFEPKDPKDAINIEGLPWRQKIIIRYVPSSLFVRVLVYLLTVVATVALVREYVYGKRN